MQKKHTLLLMLLFYGANICAQMNNYKDSATFYFTKSDYNKAIYFGEMSLAENRKKANGIIDTALCVAASDLAFFYVLAEKYQLAEPRFLEALQFAEKVYGKDNYNYAAILNNYGRLKRETGRYSEAEGLIKKAIFITKNKSGKDLEKNLVFENDLGHMYLSMGNYNGAEIQFLNVLDARKKMMNDKGDDYAINLNNLAVCYNYMGNFSESERIFGQVVDLFTTNKGTQHSITATAISNLGIVSISSGNYERADSLLKKSLQIKEKIFGRESDQYALALNSLGKLYSKTENYAEAEQAYLKALEIRKRVYGQSHPNYAVTVGDLGSFYFNSKNYLKSELYLNEAIALTKNNIGEENTAFLNMSYNLANLYRQNGKVITSDSIFIKNASIEKKLLFNSLEFLSEKELLAYIKNKEISVGYPFSLLWNFNSSQLIQTTLNNCLTYKGIAIQNTTALSKQMQQSKDTVLASLWKDYKSGKALLNKTLALPIVKRTVNTDSLTSITNQQEKELLRQSASYRDMKNKLNTTWQDVRNNLTTNEAAVEFVKFNYFSKNQTDTVYYAAMLLRPKDTVPVFIKLFQEKQLKAALKSFAYTASPQNRGSSSIAFTGNKTTNKTTTILYNLLWQPLEPYLKQTKTVYFSPDGLLHQLAFAAISYKKDSLLCDKYKLVQVASIRQVATDKQNKIIPPSSIALFGGINYNSQQTDTAKQTTADPYAYVYQQNRGTTGVDSFAYLPHTLTEIESIKKSMEAKKGKVVFLNGDKATEAAYRNLGGASSPDVVHFATHGFTLPDTSKQKTGIISNTFKVSDNPLLRSGLVLAGGNKGWKGTSQLNEDDGILTALEIAALPLQNTKLAVLSACETGVGELRGSEGVFGLQRAFKIAGVEYVMATLWQVPDKETKEFMTSFYSQWLNGKTLQQSFASTQQIMRKKYPPYYWAGFTLVH